MMTWGYCRKKSLQKLFKDAIFSIPAHRRNITSFIQEKRPLLNLAEINVFNPDDLKVASDRAISKIQFIRDALKGHVNGKHPLPSTTKCLELLDAISNELCLAIDTAEFVRNAHQNGEYQQAASEVFAKLNTVIADLNADTNLYNILRDIIGNKELFLTLSENDQQVALDLFRDFKLEGIHLSKEHRQNLQQMNHTVSELESQWSHNILHSSVPNTPVETDEDFEKYYATLGPFPKRDRDNFQQLSRWIGRNHIQQPSDAVDAQILVIPRDQRIMGMCMASVQNDQLRERLWWEYSLTPRANIATLPTLLHHRQRLAQFLGYQHYAEKTLLKSVAKNTEAVRDLIKTLSTAARPYAQEVLTLFRARKLYLSQHGHSSTGVLSAGIQNLFSSLSSSSTSSSNIDAINQVELQPWDISYLQHQSISSDLLSLPSNKTQHHSKPKSTVVDSAEYDRAVQKIKEYFPISRCLEGLALVTESLFGVKMVQENLDSHEIWIHQDRQPGDILKFHLIDEQQPSQSQHLGTVYIDLYRRPHKFPGAAHFTVRCGCSTVEYHHQSTSSSSYDPKYWRSKKQTPIVALVFPFSPPSSVSQGMIYTNTSNSAALDRHCLSLMDVETLFHEWGHALHSLLSQSKYQHHSGTRGSTDFIEIPSHLLEHFARHPEVIRKWAKHYRTGEAIPESLLETALCGKSSYQGLDLQVQIALSLADQYLLSDSALTASVLSPSFAAATNAEHISGKQKQLFLQAMDGIASLQAEYTDLPFTTISSSPTSSSALSGSQQWLLAPSTSSSSDAPCGTWRIPYSSMLNHRHFVGYAGSYHSYLYAKVVAAQIWDRLFVGHASSDNGGSSVLSREMGIHLRRELLAWGSSKPPEVMLQRLLRANTKSNSSFEIDPEPYLRMMLRGLA